jgi:hypothetical protein
MMKLHCYKKIVSMLSFGGMLSISFGQYEKKAWKVVTSFILAEDSKQRLLERIRNFFSIVSKVQV